MEDNEETNPTEEEIIEPETIQPPSPMGEIGELIKFADTALQNPIVQSTIKNNPGDVVELIRDHAGNYESLVYDHIQSNYPELYDALQEVRDNEEDEDQNITKNTGRIPYKRFTDDVLNLDDEGYSMSQIADILTENYDKRVWPMQISRILKKADQADKADPEPKTKPKGKALDDLANVVAKKIGKSQPVQVSTVPAPIPGPVPVSPIDPNLLKAVKAMDSINRIVTAGKWCAIILVSGIIGFIINEYGAML